MDAAQIFLQGEIAYKNWLNNNFQNAPFVTSLEFIAFSGTILQAVSELGAARHQLKTGAPLPIVTETLRQSLNAITLPMNISADLGRVWQAAETQDLNATIDAAEVVMVGLLFALVAAGILAAGGAPMLAILAGASKAYLVGTFLKDNWETLLEYGLKIASPLNPLVCDPLVLDLDGDGVELTVLPGSHVHFDFGQDGFAERTGWVSPDDGILVYDHNRNGTVDGAAELFGSPTIDGFDLLETKDSNGDGVIDDQDVVFEDLKVWRDLNSDGQSQEGELLSLAEAGIASIALTRTESTATNEGHEVGYQASYQRTDGTTGVAQSIYFQVDGQDTVPGPTTPGFTPAEGIESLPQLPRAGLLQPLDYKLSVDAELRQAWQALATEAPQLGLDAIRDQLESLMLRWADADDVIPSSRGAHVDARHLAFLEAYFGDAYRETQISSGLETRTSPVRPIDGARLEASFEQILTAFTTIFLSQALRSSLLNSEEEFETILTDFLASPYLAYSFIDFRKEFGEDETAPPTPGNIGAVLDFIIASVPTEFAAAVAYFSKALPGLRGVIYTAFDGDSAAFQTAAAVALGNIADPLLHDIATKLAFGTNRIGSVGNDGLIGAGGDDVFVGGAGHDTITSGAGSDVFVYAKGDGSDWINDASANVAETDRLIFTDLDREDIAFERTTSNDLFIRVTETNHVIGIKDFFKSFSTEARGVDSIHFANGEVLSRSQIASAAEFRGTEDSDVVLDTSSNDYIRPGTGHDRIVLSEGDDTIAYARGDGYDVIEAKSLPTGTDSGRDVLFLSDLNPDDVEFARIGHDALQIRIISTGETVRELDFYTARSAIDIVRFANGLEYDVATIKNLAGVRGTETADVIGAFNSDVVDGGAGDDTILGSVRGDTYVWNAGDGNDIINDTIATNDTHVDALQIGVRSGQVRLSYHGDDLLVTVLTTGEVIRIAQQFFGASNLISDYQATWSYGLERIAFADGEVWDRQTIARKTGQQFKGRDIEEDPDTNVMTDEFGNFIIGVQWISSAFGVIAPASSNGIMISMSPSGPATHVFGSLNDPTTQLDESETDDLIDLNGVGPYAVSACRTSTGSAATMKFMAVLATM
jgi:Ca2+-binding RTX toxin-like protein